MIQVCVWTLKLQTQTARGLHGTEKFAAFLYRDFELLDVASFCNRSYNDSGQHVFAIEVTMTAVNMAGDDHADERK